MDELQTDLSTKNLPVQVSCFDSLVKALGFRYGARES